MAGIDFLQPIPEGALRFKCPHCGGDVGAWCIGAGGGGGSGKIEALEARVKELERELELKDAIYEHDIRAALDDPESFGEEER